jgi:hypothetical protein
MPWKQQTQRTWQQPIPTLSTPLTLTWLRMLLRLTRTAPMPQTLI